jgi:hypothetical protein
MNGWTGTLTAWWNEDVRRLLALSRHVADHERVCVPYSRAGAHSSLQRLRVLDPQQPDDETTNDQEGER